MALVDRLIVTWDGFPGAPGFSVHYAEHGSFGVRQHLIDFYNTFNDFLPGDVLCHFPNTGDVFESTTGDIQQPWQSGTPVTVTGGGLGAQYGAPTGAHVNWITTTIAPPVVPGKRPRVVRGRTYIVPLINNVFGASGEIGASTVQILSDGANTLVSASQGHLVLWAKPHYAKDPPHAQERVGTLAPVVSSKVTSVAAVLRSRRD